MRTFVYSNAADMTHSLVHRVAQHMRARLAEVPTIRMAFSGGPPLPMFTALARERLDWSRVIVMLVDEYVVPSISYDSHARLLRQTLLRDQAAKAQFEPIDVDGVRCSRRIVEQANAYYAQSDVVVLGIPRDGRMAAITGDATELDVALSVRAEPGYVAVRSPGEPKRRISLNLSAMLSSRQVFLSVSGTDKLQVFESARRRPSSAVPISLLMHQERVVLDVYQTQ
jgi:6-phosphogluconolactonase